jgi:predicted nucleotidyltransferase
MLPLIEEHIDDIRRLCERYGVWKLELFGSACRGEFDPRTSDLDFLAEFRDILVPGYADRYLGFAEGLETTLGLPVDVVTANTSLNTYFRQEIEECKILVYEAESRVAAA